MVSFTAILNYELGSDEELVGKPVAICREISADGGGLEEVGKPIVGRVEAFEGDIMSGRHSILNIRTPHGSLVRTGRAFVRRANAEDLARLVELDAAAGAKKEP